MDHAFISNDAAAAAYAVRQSMVPATVRAAFQPVAGSEAAEAYTRQLTHTHYENFSAVSILLPRHLRQDFCNVYAFCRTADDLADEVSDRDKASQFLAAFKAQTRACYAGTSTTAVFVALTATIKRHDIPIEPFLDLIDAFEQDQRVDRYDTFEDLVAYCNRSANPVGRLVLYMCGYRDERRQSLSDRTCTALQLANFWQDVRRDMADRSRIYLPRESREQFGVSEEQIREGRFDEKYRRLVEFEVERTEALFKEGEGLLSMIDGSVRPQIALFGKGGRAVLEAIRRQGYDTLSRRPVLSRWQKGRLVMSALGGCLAARLTGKARA
ncbi:MAG: Squalene/phytoene synthase [Phycisphaerales bacterium]|nr:Squalene/phytoene synthase [Phycisphaerales bacterium]MDB5303271.1 Squalene/phytoene synthase [Phycisphaerales bacterium]